jgi:hypothetical protein
MICIPKLVLEIQDISLLALFLSPRLDDNFWAPTLFLLHLLHSSSLQPPKPSWYCPLLVPSLPIAQPSSTSLLPLWSRTPPLLAALHCHCLLHIVSIITVSPSVHLRHLLIVVSIGGCDHFLSCRSPLPSSSSLSRALFDCYVVVCCRHCHPRPSSVVVAGYKG